MNAEERRLRKVDYAIDKLNQAEKNLDKAYKRLVAMGCRNVEASQEFDSAYEQWMTLRANLGNKFAKDLGY